ncbi:DUF995 domain-containing protein [Rhizobium sp. CCGE 510]|uniref:DUF995 domain-containing protein n=1 Tax=Rhizobium sp. CCGE 510 TaxID=1132836 RepID=UPI00027B833F|nr:DUF995 domain-containing protein [Rhizobium sp. CCGE 510]EJT06773.1 hypothetical protein RCCGE510_03228 [Rhizobium sp. CCGE 510]
MENRLHRPLRLAAATLLIAQLAATTVWADFKFDGGGQPAPAAEIQKFFSGKSWLWPCKGCGAYFAPDGKFTAVWAGDKGDFQTGHGTWTSKDGALCWSNDVRTSTGMKDPTTDRCWEARFGPGTEGGKKKVKQALGLKMQKKPDYFWVWKDGSVYDKEFKTGDKISATATKIEAKFPAQ